MKVMLRADEITIAHILGRMRSLIARSAGVVDAKLGKQDGTDADVNGFLAEYAFAKFQNVFPDLGLVPRSGSYDVIANGKRCDIKATTYQNGRLLCTLKENHDVDVYVLAIVDLPTITFAGWAYKSDLRVEANLMDLGHGKGYALPQDKLRKFKEEKAEA